MSAVQGVSAQRLIRTWMKSLPDRQPLLGHRGLGAIRLGWHHAGPCSGHCPAGPRGFSPSTASGTGHVPPVRAGLGELHGPARGHRSVLAPAPRVVCVCVHARELCVRVFARAHLGEVGVCTHTRRRAPAQAAPRPGRRSGERALTYTLGIIHRGQGPRRRVGPGHRPPPGTA
jgi:hypothetical protein